MLLFKFAGLVILFTVSVSVGFLKSYNLRGRFQKLNYFHRGISALSMRIRSENGEIEQIIPLCFEGDNIVVQNGKINYNQTFLTASDKELLTDFFSNFGTRSREDEYERTCLFCKLIEKQCGFAESDCSKLCKLYGTVGILCGIFLCIFFL